MNVFSQKQAMSNADKIYSAKAKASILCTFSYNKLYWNNETA
jgi:hypothetical protein